MRKYTERELRKRAQSAATKFLDDGTPLNDTIAAMVDPDELTDHHIARICEMANHDTRGRMFKDKDVDQSRVVFPAAKSVEIIKITRKPEVAMNIEKEASAAPSAFSIPDEYFQSPYQVIAGATYQPESFMEKTASARTDVMRSQLDVIEREYEKIAAEARGDLRVFGAARADFFKQAGHDLRFGRATPEQIVAMAASVDDNENGAYDLLCGNIDLMKEAMPVDNLKTTVDAMRQYINPDIKAKYVLGNTPLLVKYKGMVTASERVRSKANRMHDLYGEYGDIEKQIVQADLGGKAEREIPKVAGHQDFSHASPHTTKSAAVEDTAADAAKAKPGRWGKSMAMAAPSLMEVPFLAYEGYDAYKTDKAHYGEMARLRKDPGAAGKYMQKLVERNPEQWAKFQKNWGGNRWLTNTMAQKARARKAAKEHKPGDIERMPAAQSFKKFKDDTNMAQIESYDKATKHNRVEL